MYKTLKINSWRQFNNTKIDFHNRLTILTGTNGSGKTTILNLLADQFGWIANFVSGYQKDLENKPYYTNNIISREEKNTNITEIGELILKNGQNVEKIILSTSKIVSNGTYNLNRYSKNRVQGVYINSNRPQLNYKKLVNLPTTTLNREEIYMEYLSFNRTYVKDTFRNSNDVSATLIIKRTLASLAIFGEGNKNVDANEVSRELFIGFVEILKKVLPDNIGFEGIVVHSPEVILKTKTGDFPIDAVSGGISSIINIVWQIFMSTDQNKPLVVLLDEPENHLHPELQKTLLPNLIEAFPKAQFIVTTHNPFIISSVRNSSLYVLNYNENSKVVANKLDMKNMAAKSSDILKNVLGIDSTFAFWVEKKLDLIVEKYVKLGLDESNVLNLKEELEEIGMADMIPKSIVKVFKENDKTK